jgi:peroxiredoxin
MPMPDNDGHPVSLHDFRGKRVLLLFWNPACGFCARMLDDLRAWERSALRDAPQLIIVSTGSAAQNLEMDMRAPVLQDPSNIVAPVFGVTGTPMAVAVDAGGHITSHLAAGAEAVFELARNLFVLKARGQTAP